MYTSYIAGRGALGSHFSPSKGRIWEGRKWEGRTFRLADHQNLLLSLFISQGKSKSISRNLAFKEPFRILRIDCYRTFRNVGNNGSEPQSFPMYLKQFSDRKRFSGSPKKIGPKKCIFIFFSCKCIHCEETVHFSWPNGQYEKCSTPLWYFYITDIVLPPTQ